MYVSDGFDTDDGLLLETVQGTKTYRTIAMNGHYYIQTGSTVNALDRVLYLETLRDVSVVFNERELGFRVYRQVTVLMLLFGTIIMHLIASWLTKPIRLLTRATKRMAAGDYDYRAKLVSDDELGQLTRDFNKMAEALEENMNELEAEIQAREDFVGAFAHELKTPLTSIIGYADLLRSRKLDEEKSFMSANYIYTEGKRLEAMSIRLLDIMVTRHGQVQFQEVQAESLFSYLRDMFQNNNSMKFVYSYDQALLLAESNLIITVLINLLDYGIGIPAEELQKITKAFYMVDKSRSRSRNGAGLGLALCTEILALHHSKLEITSTLGEGTSISFLLPNLEKEGEWNEKDNH